MTESLYFYTEAFSTYNFGTGHPFSPLRQIAADALIRSADLIAPHEIRCDIEPAPREALEWVHTSRYIDIVERASRTGELPGPMAGLGTADNPVFAGMHEAAAIRVGATLAAMRAVGEGEALHAVNLGGGLHHAMPDRASGFCIYNDIAVAIAYARREWNWRIAYIDIDAHHGDGVQWCFYDDPNVLTVSIHQSGETLFPGTGNITELGEGAGYGTSLNIPLVPGTRDESWWECFRRIVPDAVRRFRPDCIVSQHGADAHRLDPLTHLELSTRPLNRAARLIHQLAHECCDGRWVAVGGGGYAVLHVVPRVWATLWAVTAHRTIPERVPQAWRREWGVRTTTPLPVDFDDPPGDAPDTPETMRRNSAAVADLERMLAACDGISPPEATP